jgi:hypothetical protein
MERRTDARGLAKFDAVALGETQVLAAAHGYLPSFATADVGRESVVWVNESSPRRVRVRVVDMERRPVAAARVLATSRAAPDASGVLVSTGTTVAQIDGDTELLTPRTDAQGCVVLEVPAGSVEYIASLAGAATRTLSDDEEVRIVLAPPEPR